MHHIGFILMGIVMEPATIQTEYPVCTLCGGMEGLDAEVVLCVSMSTGQMEDKYSSDPKEWTVRLCRNCEVTQYLEVARQKQKENAASIAYSCIAGVVGGGISGSFWRWGQGSGAATNYEQVDQRLAREGGNWIVAAVVLVATIALAVSLVMIPVLLLARVRRSMLTHAVKRRRAVLPSQRPTTFSHAAKHILIMAEANTLPISHGAFALPEVSDATKRIRMIKVQHPGGRWEDRDGSIW
jgi:hypothetical protein